MGGVIAHRRVGATRAALAAGAVAIALLRAAAAAAVVMALVGVADWAVGLDRPLRSGAVPVGAAVGALVALVSLWRARRVFSLESVALWIEERRPALRFALVTVLDPRFAGGSLPELERAVSRAHWRSSVPRALARAVVLPSTILLVALGMRAILPSGIVARVEAPRSGDSLARPPRGDVSLGSRLTPLVATVTPPAYSGLNAVTLEEPGGITALPSSSLELQGRGSPAGIEVRLGEAVLHAAGTAGRWRVIFAMPRRPSVVRLRDGSETRVIVLEPRPDSAPVVTLVKPARDTVMREARGALPLAANASDDFGLGALWLEYIVSSGEGESFTFRSGVVRRVAAAGERRATVTAALPLDSLMLRPGDVVHLRAVAVDVNTATGPDTGVSETRAMRVPRASEYDSVAVEGAPPPDVGSSELSERMLIQLAEALERRRPGLARAVVVDESRRIGVDQARLRKRVGDIIFIRLGESSGAEESGVEERTGAMTPEEFLRAAEEATEGAEEHALDFEGGETPVVAVNRPLLEAYNAMWDAERDLGIGEPGAALPHMRAALAAIQRAREAERAYLRGRPAKVVVDLARVRLAGDIDSASASARVARARLATTAARNAARFDAALALLPSSPTVAIDSLLLLRVDALGDAPPFAAALAAAVDALRRGGDATAALARARRVVAGAPRVRPHASDWGGAW